ncbi:hypothetical protein BS78_04G042100 [Paspalum vaginatum]|nr:hypothetical protein BS78_04G042100 [Paspalum vaginatum]
MGSRTTLIVLLIVALVASQEEASMGAEDYPRAKQIWKCGVKCFQGSGKCNECCTQSGYPGGECRVMGCFCTTAGSRQAHD